MLVLGIETTCDETAAAVIERGEDGSGRILSNVVHSQIKDHTPFGGVVPEIAARAHVELLDGIIATAMQQAGTSFTGLSGVEIAPTQLGVESPAKRVRSGGRLVSLCGLPASVGEQQ